MDTILGFAVLTGPLWLIVLLIPLAIWIAVKVSKRFKTGGARVAAGVGIFLLVFAVPFADEIVGRVYLNYLCATQAGVKVYQTVELPGEYWDGEGRATFLNPKRGLDMALLGDRITQRTTMGPFLQILGLDERRVQVVNKHTNQVVGEVVSYVHWGGWIIRNLNPAGRSGVDCSNLHGVTFWFDFYSSLFARTASGS